MPDITDDLVQAKSTALAGPWFYTTIATAQGVADFANISPVNPPGGLVISRRPDGRFDVIWRV